MQARFHPFSTAELAATIARVSGNPRVWQRPGLDHVGGISLFSRRQADRLVRHKHRARFFIVDCLRPGSIFCRTLLETVVP